MLGNWLAKLSVDKGIRLGSERAIVSDRRGDRDGLDVPGRDVGDGRGLAKGEDLPA